MIEFIIFQQGSGHRYLNRSWAHLIESDTKARRYSIFFKKKKSNFSNQKRKDKQPKKLQDVSKTFQWQKSHPTKTKHFNLEMKTKIKKPKQTF